jgi:hypothetical protein
LLAGLLEDFAFGFIGFLGMNPQAGYAELYITGLMQS